MNELKPNLNFDNEKEEVDKDVLLGEAMRFWISRNGILNLDTPSKEIFKFYEENRSKSNS